MQHIQSRSKTIGSVHEAFPKYMKSKSMACPSKLPDCNRFDTKTNPLDEKLLQHFFVTGIAPDVKELGNIKSSDFYVPQILYRFPKQVFR